VLWGKACRKGRFAKDTVSEGREDLGLMYLARANLGPITLVLGQVYDRFMFLVAWAYKTRDCAGEVSNQELRDWRVAEGWPCWGRAVSRLPSAAFTR